MESHPCPLSSEVFVHSLLGFARPAEVSARSDPDVDERILRTKRPQRIYFTKVFTYDEWIDIMESIRRSVNYKIWCFATEKEVSRHGRSSKLTDLHRPFDRLHASNDHKSKYTMHILYAPHLQKFLLEPARARYNRSRKDAYAAYHFSVHSDVVVCCHGHCH